MLPTRLGPYELLEELGSGGMATVYRARQPSMERDVAVKVIRRNLADELTSLERFQREARLIARLEHPHILPVHDFDGAHNPPYIVMRYLAGGTLAKILGQGPLPFNDIIHLLRQVASALDYAHRQGIIHRDLKPSNILVDDDGNAWLTDFGIARMVNQAAITQSGTAVGTPAYMSPEQAMGANEVGPRADLYALGVLTFELLVGSVPFSAESQLAIMLKHLNEPVPRATSRNADLPTSVDDVLLRALAKHPEERYETANEFVAALAGALNVTATRTPTGLRTAVQMKAVRATTSLETHVTPSEQNKIVTAVYVDATEYGEIVEENENAERAHRALHALWESVAEFAVLAV